MAQQSAGAHALADPLAEAYRQAWEHVEAQRKSLLEDPKQARKRARLLEIQRSITTRMAQLDEEAADWVSTKLPQIYSMGGSAGVAEATSGAAEFVWSVANEEAAQRIATRLYQDLLTATSHVSADTKRMIRAVGRDKALAAALEGQTAKQAAREMARVLKTNGVSAVTYANGAKHGLGEYAEMAIRTVTGTTYNEASLNGAAEHGTKYWEVFDGPFCGWASHDDRQALGMIVTRDEAAGHPLSHPNCRRAFGPRPDITTPKQAREAIGHVTPGQTKAQIAADKARLSRTTKPSPSGPTPPSPDFDIGNAPAMDAIAPAVDAVSKVPTVEKLIDQGWDPAAAILEHKRLLKNARNVERRARNKAKKAGSSLIDEDLKQPAYGDHPQPKALYDPQPGVGHTFRGPGGNDSKAWFDRLREDTQEYIPVQNLTIQGHRVEAGVATRRNGVSYLYETKPGETITQAMRDEFEANIAMAEAVYSSLPAGARQYQRGAAFLRGNNPMDPYWGDKYNMPDFKSAATGGDGSTTFWNAKVNPGTLAHEFGHNLDKNWAQGKAITKMGASDLGHTRSWAGSMQLDEVGSGSKQSFQTFTETRPGGHPITPGTKGVTKYGQASIDEDFAESVRLYLKDRREGKLGYLAPKPGQALGTNVRFVDMYPHRAEILDRVFGTQTDFDTPWRTARKAELHKDFKSMAETIAIDFGGSVESAARHYGLRQVDVEEVFAKLQKELAEEAAAKKAAQEALEAAQKAAKEAQAPLTAKDLSFADKTSIGVKAGNAKKFALKLGKSEAEAKQVFLFEKARLTQARLDELNAKRGITKAPGDPGVMRPGADPQIAASNASHVRSSGKYRRDPHPHQRYDGSDAASQRKSYIAAELGQRMNNREDWELFRTYRRATIQIDPGDFDAVASDRRQLLLDDEASQRVQTWAATSGDSDRQAVSMQMAVKDEFGITGDAMVRVGTSHYGTSRGAIEAYYKQVEPFYRRFARRMYEFTQDDFAAAGITEIHVYRGMNVTADWAKAGERRPLLQPVNSWSTNISTARGFGTTIFSATVPVNRVLGSARTGFGCYNEYEYVIFDTEGLAKVGSGSGSID